MPQNPNAFAAHVTRRLAELRRERGITTEAMAERLGTAVQNVRRIEAGQNITLRTLVRWAQAMGFTVDVVFKHDPKGPRSPGPGRKG